MFTVGITRKRTEYSHPAIENLVTICSFLLYVNLNTKFSCVIHPRIFYSVI